MSKIIGIDEVGRGAWAGPLLFCAVILSSSIDGLADSKTLSKNQREFLTKKIKENTEFIGLGWVTPQEVDDMGLTKASTLACERAIRHAPKNTKILIDGSVNFLPLNKIAECVIGGDAKVPEISAASIVAKVERDSYMSKVDKLYENYNFRNNVGYGTKDHKEAIEKHGLTPIHRWSYKPIKAFLDSYEA